MKHGQAAMEFLLTYGWAILVVIAAVAALAFFGILNPAAWLPDKCETIAGFHCHSYRFDVHDPSIAGSEVTFTLRSGFQEQVTLYPVNLTCTKGCLAGQDQGDLSGDPVSCGGYAEWGGLDTPPYVSSVSIQPGEEAIVYCRPSAAEADIVFESEGTRAILEFSFNYQLAGDSVNHTATGQVTSIVQERS